MAKSPNKNTSFSDVGIYDDEDTAPAVTVEQPDTPSVSLDDPTVAPDGVTETTMDASLPVVVVDPADEGLDELPEGAVLLGGNPESQLPETGSTVSQPLPVAAFADEHVGQGGSYAIGDDGVRRPLFEEYYIPANNPGDPMVRKYRRVP